MPPFQYDSFSSRPYLGTIADLIQEPSRAQARAAEIGGQAIGGALSQTGQGIAGAIQQVTDPRVQMEREQVAAMKRAQGYLTATNRIVTALTQQNPDGTRTIDRRKLQAQLAAANVPPAMQKDVFASLDDVDTSIQKFNQIKIDHRADFAHSALQSELGKTPEGLVTLAGLAKANGLVTDEELGPIFTAVAHGTDPKAVLEGVRGFSEKYKDLSKPIVLPREGSKAINPVTGATIAESPKAAPRPVSIAPGAKLVNPDTGAMIAEGGPQKRTDAEQKLDAYAKALGKTRAEDLTDPERLAFEKREKTMASAVATAQHATERNYDVAHPIPEKSKSQDALEQQYRTVLARGLSSRSGGLGLEDAKVQQANHLLALLDQTYDPKTDTYTIPKVLQGELAAGLARLVAPGGQVGIEMMREFNQKTAAGDLAGALTYITGTPFPTATQDIARMLKDSIERQGKVALENREGEMRYLRGLAPTDLEEPRRTRLEATTLNPLRQSRLIQNKATGERKLQVSTDGGQTWK